MVRARQCTRQEQCRVLQLGLCFALESLSEVLHGDMGCNLAMQVSAHAVGKHHEQGIARVAVGDAILIGLAFADAAFLKNGKSHDILLQPLPMKVLSRDPRSVNQVAGMASPACFCINAFCRV